MKKILLILGLMAVCVTFIIFGKDQTNFDAECNRAVFEYEHTYNSKDQELIDEAAYKLYKAKVKKMNFDETMEQLKLK